MLPVAFPREAAKYTSQAWKCSFKRLFSTDLAAWMAVRVCQLVSFGKSSGLVFMRAKHPSASCYIRDERFFFFWGGGGYVVIFATTGVCLTFRSCHFLYAAICLPTVAVLDPGWGFIGL